MRTHNSIQTSDDAAFIGTDSRNSAPRLASIHLLSSSTRAGQNPGDVRTRRITPKCRNEMAELLTNIDGLPIVVRLLIKDMPAEMQSDFVSNGSNIHSLLLSTLEKMVDRMRGSSSQSDAPSEQPVTAVKKKSSEDSLSPPPTLTNETVLRVGPLELDLIERAAKRADRKIDLRPREFHLLKYMMQRRDNLLTRATLLKDVWRYKFVPETNLVDVHMGRLRRKIDGSNEFPIIRNVRGLGFVLSAIPCSISSPLKPTLRSGNLDVADQSPRPVERAAR
jgi:DNA-binding winged helix-turn-helix (wHTH) protein